MPEGGDKVLPTRPIMVTSEEAEEVGGLRPLSNKERTKISKMFQISEDEITTLPFFIFFNGVMNPRG